MPLRLLARRVLILVLRPPVGRRRLGRLVLPAASRAAAPAIGPAFGSEERSCISDRFVPATVPSAVSYVRFSFGPDVRAASSIARRVPCAAATSVP
jgi:hypothetical protein